MQQYVEVPPAIVLRIHVACAHLPEAHEDDPFAGVRWRIRGRTLVHVLTSSAGPDGPETHMTVHAAANDLDSLVAIGYPFAPGWGPGLLSMRLTDDESTDWNEVKELITESYRLLAPKKLIALLGTI